MRHIRKAPPASKFIESANGPSAVGRHLGITPAAVSQWKVIPPERCIDMEDICKYTRYQMRPDVFGKDPAKKNTAAA